MKLLNSFTGLALVVAAVSMTGVVATPSFAQDEKAFDPGRYRIDITGRQRMLSQRIAKSVCFIELGYSVDMYHDYLDADYHLFDDTLHILRDGGGEFNLEPEKDRRTLQKLEEVFAHWEPFSAELIAVLETNHIDFEVEEHIREENLIMLTDMNDLASLIEQEYANAHTLDLQNAMTINIFARQRTLSQMMAKDFCYVLSGHHVDEEKDILEETLVLFQNSLDAIRNGLPAMGIAPPPTEEIKAQLDIVAEIWMGLDTIYKKVIAGETPTDEEIGFVSSESLHLLDEMNKAVQMYIVK